MFLAVEPKFSVSVFLFWTVYDVVNPKLSENNKHYCDCRNYLGFIGILVNLCCSLVESCYINIPLL